MKNIIYLLFVGLLVISCQKNDTTGKTKPQTKHTESSKIEDAKTLTQTTKKEMQAPVFVIDSFTGEAEVPRSIISLKIDGKVIEVTEAIGCEKIEQKDYEQFQIPSNAVDACGGWWAGSGDYFYIVKHPEKSYYMVMQAVVDEQQESHSYNYQSIMNITHRFN